MDEANPEADAAKPETEFVEVKDESSVVVPSCAETEFVDSSLDSSGIESELKRRGQRRSLNPIAKFEELQVQKLLVRPGCSTREAVFSIFGIELSQNLAWVLNISDVAGLLETTTAE